MKIITYNVNGLRAAVSKGLPEWLEQEQADAFKKLNCSRINIRKKH